MRTLLRIALVALTLASAALASCVDARAADVKGTPKVATERNLATAAASAIPTWSSSFVSGGSVYPYTMVGTSPFGAARTTTVSTVVVPLDLTFEAADPGASERRGTDVDDLVLASPLFQSARFNGPSYATQYANAIQKDMFWSTGGSNAAYNVLLRNDSVLPAQHLFVPARQGTGIVGATTGVPFAYVSYEWFSAQLKKIRKDLALPGSTLPIFVTADVYLEDRKAGTCCFFGLHGADGTGDKASTWVYATYPSAKLFPPKPGQKTTFMSDIHVFSHEIASWVANPFLTNIVPSWTSVLAPQYGCSNQLEVSDPLIGYGFEVKMPNGVTYHPEDAAYLSWFAREIPSRAFGGRYTYLGTFASPALVC